MKSPMRDLNNNYWQKDILHIKTNECQKVRCGLAFESTDLLSVVFNAVQSERDRKNRAVI